VSAGKETSLLALLAVLSDLLDTHAEPLFEPARAGEVLASHGDRSKAGELLEWEPRWRIRDALEASIVRLVDSVTR
jgi:nucleoside-diphosphate-sugar epimerase